MSQSQPQLAQQPTPLRPVDPQSEATDTTDTTSATSAATPEEDALPLIAATTTGDGRKAEGMLAAAPATRRSRARQ